MRSTAIFTPTISKPRPSKSSSRLQLLDQSSTSTLSGTPTLLMLREAASENATSAACRSWRVRSATQHPLTEFVRAVDELYGARRDLMLMDNNVVTSARFKEIIAEIRDLGFTPGAKLKRDGERVASLRPVDFNQGVDARILCKDRMYLRELSSICLSPLRIAFDHLGLKTPYETAVRYAHEFGMNDLSNYMLYNFMTFPPTC